MLFELLLLFCILTEIQPTASKDLKKKSDFKFFCIGIVKHKIKYFKKYAAAFKIKADVISS